MAMIYPFMQSLREASFPEPGETIQIKSFMPESGTEVTTTTNHPHKHTVQVQRDLESLVEIINKPLNFFFYYSIS